MQEKLSTQRGSFFLRSGGNAFEPVNLAEAAVAFPVEGEAEEEEEEEEEEAEEEEKVKEDQEKKPICMSFDTYLRCFDDAGFKVFGNQFAEEVPKHDYFRLLVLGKARSLQADSHWFKALEDKGKLDHEAQTQAYAVMRWHTLYTHYRDEESCTGFFVSLFRAPAEKRGDVYSFYVHEENSRKQAMSGMNTLSNFGSLHSEFTNIESAISERSPSAAGGKGKEVLFKDSTVKMEIAQAVSKIAFKNSRLFCADKSSIVDYICDLPSWREGTAPAVKVCEFIR